MIICHGEHDSGPAANRHGKEQKLRAADLHLLCRLEAKRLGVRGKKQGRMEGGREEEGFARFHLYVGISTGIFTAQISFRKL